MRAKFPISKQDKLTFLIEFAALSILALYMEVISISEQIQTQIMNNVFSFFFFSFLLIACGDKEQDDLFFDPTDSVGNWTLTETLLDPGDGSGVFEATDLNISIEIFDNHSVVGNGMLCTMGLGTGVQSAQYFPEDSIMITDCDSIPLTLGVDHNGSVLILSFPCIEPCKAKFEKQ